MSVKRLIGVLKKLDEIHGHLAELADRKREALIHNDVQEVSAITAKENQWLKTVEELLAEKKDATSEFFRSRGFQMIREVTVTELSRMVTDPAEKDELLEARDKLLATADLLRQKNDLNQKLIEQSLGYINYTLDLLIGPEDEFMYRNPLGQQQGAQRAGYFDSKA